MINNFLLLAAVAAAPIEVDVTPLSGSSVQGQLVDLSSREATLQTAGGEKTFPIKDLLKIAVRNPEPRADAPPSAWVDLADDSLLLATAYATSDGKAQIQILGGDAVEIPADLVRSVRWTRQNDELARQWREIVEGDLQGDAIVVRRNPAALDHWEGVLYDVSSQSVAFQLDGQRVAVPRTKLEGIIYYRASGRAAAEPICRVIDVHGSRWNVKSLQLEPTGIRLTTAAGAAFRLPARRIQQLDFSAGNVVYLSDLEPASVRWTPFFASPAASSQLSKLFQPRRDRGFDGGKLMLGDQVYDKGLAIHSRTELVYRLTEDFRRLRAVVGIDDRMREGGNVRLVISGDEETLVEKTVTGQDPPWELDLEIAGVRRLTILVDFGDDLDIADHLDLCEARITK